MQQICAISSTIAVLLSVFVDLDARMLGVMEKSVSGLSALCGPAHTYVLAMEANTSGQSF